VEEELESLAQSAPSGQAGISNRTTPGSTAATTSSSATPTSTASTSADVVAAGGAAVNQSGSGAAAAKAAPAKVHSSAELFEALQGRTADAPMCFTCGTKMRPAGSCFVCEGCGSTSGCS
jgi:ribonucleoside-diphosphate reductase alpha chain